MIKLPKALNFFYLGLKKFMFFNYPKIIIITIILLFFNILAKFFEDSIFSIIIYILSPFVWLALFIQTIILWRIVKKSPQRYIRDKETGFVYGLTYQDVARGLDNDKLLLAIKNLKRVLKIIPFLVGVTLFFFFYGLSASVRVFKIWGIIFSFLGIFLFFYFKYILFLYQKEKIRREQERKKVNIYQ